MMYAKQTRTEPGLNITYLPPEVASRPEYMIPALFGSVQSPAPQPDDVLDVHQVATILHVAPSTVRAIPAHELRYSHVANRRRLYFRRDVHEYLVNRRVDDIDTRDLDMNPHGVTSSAVADVFDIDAAISDLRRRAKG